MHPDFLITPYIVKTHRGLRPGDGDIYAVIYWFERLKDGKCTASNETIAEVAVCSARNVRGALDRLEEHGFIQRVFLDEARKIRKEIKTLVAYARTEQVSPDQKNLPGIETQKEKKKEEPGIELPAGINPKAWEYWKEYRKEIKKKMTPRTMKMQIAFLEAHKLDHVEIIKRSIMNGWHGLFPLPTPKQAQGNGSQYPNTRIGDMARAHEKRVSADQEAREREASFRDNEALRQIDEQVKLLVNKMLIKP